MSYSKIDDYIILFLRKPLRAGKLLSIDLCGNLLTNLRGDYFQNIDKIAYINILRVFIQQL